MSEQLVFNRKYYILIKQISCSHISCIILFHYETLFDVIDAALRWFILFLFVGMVYRGEGLLRRKNTLEAETNCTSRRCLPF